MGTIFKLIIEDDEGKTTVYPLSHGEVSIGRKDGNTIRLMERNVSRRHARLMRSNGSVFIEDLDSYNGIRINGERINGKYEVKEGDLVEIGDYHLALQAAEVEEEHRSEVSRPDSAGSGESMAGTVPDFRLPDEILAGVRAGAAAKPAGSARDTIVDPHLSSLPPAGAKSADKPGGASALSASLGGREPVAGRGEERALPPFPLGGGLQAPGVPPRKTPAENDLRGRDTKPAPGRREGDLSNSQPTAPGNPPPARVAPVPRLVCVSTSYAGREFQLSKPELVIGRVEDNDIVIEHRSVSRNHAKIVFDGRVHKIIDLQSANGILVNGEEYAMTDLRKGDLIELGHVRFRFVPSGEAFIPVEDEIREMREAGISVAASSETPTAPASARALETSAPSAKEPAAPARLPKRDETPEAQPHFDPSTAATVTDTPISALAVEARTPEVQAPLPSMTPPLGLEKRPEPAPRRPEAPSSVRTEVATPKGSPPAPDQRPTEIHVSTSRQNGAHTPVAHAPVAPAPAKPAPAPLRMPPPTTDPYVEVSDAGEEEPPSKKMGLYIGAAVGVVALVGVAFALLRGGKNEHDAQLEAHFQAKDFAAAARYCELHTSAFGDQVASLKLCVKAQSELAKAKPPEAPPAPEPSAQPSPAEALGPSGALEKTPPESGAVEEPPPGEEPATAVRAADDAALPEGDAGGPASAGAARLQPKKPALARAKQALERGRQLASVYDFNAAMGEFKKCIEANAAMGECYAQLGLMYELTKQPDLAVANYDKALERGCKDPKLVRTKREEQARLIGAR